MELGPESTLDEVSGARVAANLTRHPDVVTVDSQPPDHPGQIVVKHHDQAQLAWLHHDLLDRSDECRPGTRVLYDSQRRFVLGVVDTTSDGTGDWDGDGLTDLQEFMYSSNPTRSARSRRSLVVGRSLPRGRGDEGRW